VDHVIGDVGHLGCGHFLSDAGQEMYPGHKLGSSFSWTPALSLPLTRIALRVSATLSRMT
jgi:hypothetical protein